MNLLEISKLCEKKLLELGVDSFWYWDVGVFAFAGDETTVSVSGIVYRGQNHPGQYLYVRYDTEKDIQTHFIHVVIYGEKQWNDYLNMRDYS